MIIVTADFLLSSLHYIFFAIVFLLESIFDQAKALPQSAKFDL